MESALSVNVSKPENVTPLEPLVTSPKVSQVPSFTVKLSVPLPKLRVLLARVTLPPLRVILSVPLPKLRVLLAMVRVPPLIVMLSLPLPKLDVPLAMVRVPPLTVMLSLPSPKFRSPEALPPLMVTNTDPAKLELMIRDAVTLPAERAMVEKLKKVPPSNLMASPLPTLMLPELLILTNPLTR